MPSQFDYDLIRDYLHGLVDKNSANEIAELIATDETARSIAEGILFLEKDFQNEAEIEKYLENFRQVQLRTIQGRFDLRKKRGILWLKVAATLILVALIGYVLQIDTGSPGAIALVDAELSNPYAVSNIVRSPGETTPFELGLENYASRNYAAALQHFERASGSTDDLATLTFYEALSHLYSRHYDHAIRLFQSKVIADSRYAQQSRWHLALAAIKAGNDALAKSTLDVIVGSDRHYKHEAALQLYGKLY